MDSCECLCGCEFDTLTVYLNFKDLNLEDVVFAIDSWRFKYNIDLREVRLCYYHPSYKELQKYGQHCNHMDDIKYLLSLGRDQINFFTNFESIDKDYSEMFEYTINHNSIVMFIGTKTDRMKIELDKYLEVQQVPIIEISNSFKIRPIWVGEPDYDYNDYRDNLS